MAANKHIFTPMEKKCFLDILIKYRIVESKDTDGASLKNKNDAWDSITREFNANPHATKASNKQLRRLWKNLKQRQRDALNKQRQNSIATGGGPLTSNTVIDPDVAEVLIVGIEDGIDSDTLSETNHVMPVDPSQSLPNHSQVTHHLPSMDVNVEISSAESDPEIPITGTLVAPTTPAATTPALPSPLTTPNIPRSSQRSTRSNPSLVGVQRQKNDIFEKEYLDRQRRANLLHDLEMQVLQERLKEAKAKAREAEAKAELAEIILVQKRSHDITPPNH